MNNGSEVSGDTTAARDIAKVDDGHAEVVEVSDTLEKSSDFSLINVELDRDLMEQYRAKRFLG